MKRLLATVLLALVAAAPAFAGVPPLRPVDSPRRVGRIALAALHRVSGTSSWILGWDGVLLTPVTGPWSRSGWAFRGPVSF